MTMHKLTAGDGYTYLTRHIAGGDVDRTRGQDPAAYYTAEGNPAGRWIGRGAPLLGVAGQPVTEAQMRALFGHGMHPDADRIVAAYRAAHVRAGMSEAQVQRVVENAAKAATLGRPFPVFTPLDPFDDRVNDRLAALSAETGRAPTTAEVAGVRREEARRQRAAVAGYDLAFAPVKSAALLWALDERPWVRDAVEDAHAQARNSALELLEEHAAFTRAGAGGVAQIDTHGLVAAAFDHRDSRDGDPNLHTHVAIANKVQGVDGVWRSLDARALYRMTVAVSEHYNTVFQAALTRRLGVTWTERRTPGGKEPVYEVAGVPAAFVAHFSRRRAAIEGRYAQLVGEYRAVHGRDPAPAVAHKLARQANLDTRQGKKAPRSLGGMRAAWRQELAEAFGTDAVRRLAAAVPGPPQVTGVSAPAAPATVRAVTAPHAGQRMDAVVEELAARVVVAVGEQRSTWTVWNLRAETERLLRAKDWAVDPGQVRALAEKIVERAISPGHSILVEAPAVTDEPAALRRADRASVFTEHAAHRYTSAAVLNAEARLVAAAHTVTDGGIAPSVVVAALENYEARAPHPLDAGQRALVTAFATDPRQLVVGIGAAGTGKTTATRAYLHVLQAAGRRLIPLATSAASAAVLAGELGVPAENVHKFLHEHARGPHAAALAAGKPVPASHAVFAVAPGDVVLVDEAGMAGTPNFDRIVALAAAHGATVRSLGDYRQLAAVESGGALRLIAADAGAVELSVLHRFTDPAEAHATLGMRLGDSTALDFYQQRDRISGGSRDAMTDAAYTAWHTDMTAGRVSLMVAATNTDVTALSARARADRVAAGLVEPGGVRLADGNRAGAGDWIVTRHNQRRLSCHGGRDFVRNGDAWTVTRRHRDGSLTVRHHDHGGTVRLPAGYVAEQVQLLYATTAHRAQGSTVDTAHVLADESMAREHLYVAATRARHATRLYVTTHEVLALDEDDRLDRAAHDPDAYAAREILDRILAREAAELSATETIRVNQEQAASLATLMPRFAYAVRQAADTRYRDLLGVMLDSRSAEALVSDPSWESLAAALHDAEGHGWQPEQALAAALRHGPLDQAEEPARVLARRITDITADGAPGPWLTCPTSGQAERYADLISQLTGQRPDPSDALDTPPALRTETTAPFVPRDVLAAVLGSEPAEQITGEPAWPALRSALNRAYRAGHDTTELLRVAHTRHTANGPGVRLAQVLAEDLHHHTNTTPAAVPADGWSTLAWALAAHEDTGGDPPELLPVPAGRGQPMDDVLRHINAHTRTNAAPPRGSATGAPPWTPAIPAGSTGASYLHDRREQISARVARLTDDATRDRPVWARALDAPPAAADQRATWRHALAVVAAYRDQHQISDDDPAHPLGPYISPGQPGSTKYWHAANALVTARRAAATGLSLRPRPADAQVADAAHRVAVDTYLALPQTDRDAVATAMVGRLGDFWHGHPDDLDTGVTQPAYAQQLRRALTDAGHLDHTTPHRPTTTTPADQAPEGTRRSPRPQRSPRADRRTTAQPPSPRPTRRPDPVLEPPRHQQPNGVQPRPRL
ncbi:MobF family relaxase [Cryptosporangium sp. NPDC048952]|uniref:MobF family relaxase n=1 Tax=Cryptosporangium sp. NPDC048952 TaxID=3363961 RepID=UPI0037226356